MIEQCEYRCWDPTLANKSCFPVLRRNEVDDFDDDDVMKYYRTRPSMTE